jgi:plasmid maintenance system antidote protein VapI
MGIDTDWFKRKIEESDESVRSLAAQLKNHLGKPMDHASLSRIINGKQAMTVGDAVQLAHAFGCDVKEVIRRAGFRV